MDTPTKKGIRYSDEQKKEVVDFATQYNNEHGRGGQSKASEKFGISQLTVSTWIKNAGGSKPGKAAKAPKAAKKGAKKGARGGSRSRYTDEQKKEIIDYMVTYNAENGRGGQSKASAKYGVTPLTITTWMKAAGVSPSAKGKAGRPVGSTKAAASAPAKRSASGAPSGAMSGKLNSLLALSNKIAQAESELSDLKEEFESLKASL
jgi:transposase-like protein